MVDVLALYALPYDARYPTVCLDEKPVVLRADVRPSLPPAPGRVERRDYEYERHGATNLFVMVEPLAGWRLVQVTEHRTKQDYAEVLRYLIEERYPDVECICVVQDKLNTQTAGALCETFPPQQAHRILSRLELHYPPGTGAGSTRPRSKSASSSVDVSRAPYQTSRPWSSECGHWSMSALRVRLPASANSRTGRRASSSRDFIRFSHRLALPYRAECGPS